MDKIICLNNNYSTTKLCYKLIGNRYLDKFGKIKKEDKFKINSSKFKIQNSKVESNNKDKFETILFLPDGKSRKGEGGLRTRGLFKFSYYKKKDCRWYLCNSLFEENVILPLANYKYTNLPLITIITVVFNGEKYLEETIQSIINQTYPNIEYIIIDGGSTDGTIDIIKKYENYIDYWVSENDNGIYDAMNKGLKLALGEFVGILNADDYYEEDAIENLLSLLLNSKKDYAFANVRIIEENSIIKPIYPLQKNKIYQEMLYPHISALIPKKVYKKVGLFNTKFKIAADFDMALKIHLYGFESCYLDKIVANIHIGGTSDSYKSNYEFMEIAVHNGKSIILALLTFLKQVIKLFFVRNLPNILVKKIQKLKKSRYYG